MGQEYVAVVSRNFADQDGREWTVRWAGDTDFVRGGKPVGRRPPGLIFTSRGDECFLFVADPVDLGALTEERLRELLRQADTPDD